MYHNIGVPPLKAKMKALYVLPSMFRFQMWFLKVAGFRIVKLSDMLDAIARGSLNDRLAVLTFDDGYLDFYQNALPILREYNYPATVFVVSDLIGASNVWDTSRYDSIVEPLMNLRQLIEIQRSNIQIGSHSKTHADLTKIDINQRRLEIFQSKSKLEEVLGQPVEYFCYPFGGYTEDAIEMVKDAGYKAAISTKRGFVREGDSVFMMRRIPVRLNTHPLLFIYKIMTDYEDLKGRAREG